MALQKKIQLENGVEVNYHRIVSITKITNQQTIIELASYTSESKRNEEIDALKQSQTSGEAVPINIFIDTKLINKEYNETDEVEDCYDYLKTLDDFKDAQDV